MIKSRNTRLWLFLLALLSLIGFLSLSELSNLYQLWKLDRYTGRELYDIEKSNGNPSVKLLCCPISMPCFKDDDHVLDTMIVELVEKGLTTTIVYRKTDVMGSELEVRVREKGYEFSAEYNKAFFAENEFFVDGKRVQCN